MDVWEEIQRVDVTPQVAMLMEQARHGGKGERWVAVESVFACVASGHVSGILDKEGDSGVSQSAPSFVMILLEVELTMFVGYIACKMEIMQRFYCIL